MNACGCNRIRRVAGGLGILALLATVPACGWLEPEVAATGAVSVVTEPEGARILINGVARGLSPLEVAGIPPGPVLIEARRAGHRTAYATVNVFEGQRVLHELRLEPVLGLVLVETDPPGAEVVIDEAYRGETPLLLHNLPLGTYRVRLQAERHFPRELTVDVTDRRPRLVAAELVSDAAALQVSSNPSGATVRVDGGTYGQTPVRIDRLRTGTVLVELVRDGYIPYQREMRLRSGEEYRLDADLSPLPGGLTVTTAPPGARVYLNQDFKGESPVTVGDLEPGLYRVRVAREGYAEQVRSVTLPLGARRVEEFRLDRDSGTLELITAPAGVRIYLNGEHVGTTEAGERETVSAPFIIEYLARGDHELDLRREGYRYRPRTITVQANQTLSLREQMERLFIPDTLVRTGDRVGDVYRGVLVRRHPDGSIDLETHPGIVVTLTAEEIQSIEPL
jgi:hypothetical protein